MSPILETKQPIKSVPYRGPKDLVDEIDAVAAKKNQSRNLAMTEFLRAGLHADKLGLSRADLDAAAQAKATKPKKK